MMTMFQSVVYVTFNVAPSLKFRRENDDIHCDVEVCFSLLASIQFPFGLIISLLMSFSRSRLLKRFSEAQ